MCNLVAPHTCVGEVQGARIRPSIKKPNAEGEKGRIERQPGRAAFRLSASHSASSSASRAARRFCFRRFPCSLVRFIGLGSGPVANLSSCQCHVCTPNNVCTPNMGFQTHADPFGTSGFHRLPTYHGTYVHVVATNNCYGSYSSTNYPLRLLSCSRSHILIVELKKTSFAHHCTVCRTLVGRNKQVTSIDREPQCRPITKC
jgi:hypothetical protein